MISPKKLIKIARKWQRLAALKRKRISLPTSDDDQEKNNGMSSVADKGHFVVYTMDQRRFMFPMSYLNNPIFRQLLVMSEEEFGLSGNGPITLPCDAVFMEYVVSLIQGRVDGELVEALLISISSNRCSFMSSYFPHQDQSSSHPLPVISC